MYPASEITGSFWGRYPVISVSISIRKRDAQKRAAIMKIERINMGKLIVVVFIGPFRGLV